MKVWHITPDVGYGGTILYNLTNNEKFSYDWSVEKLQYCFEHARKDFGKQQKIIHGTSMNVISGD